MTEIDGPTRDRTPPPTGISGGYQPALDGVRAVAVLLVILFHLSLDGGFQIALGGWLGVDIFFVLSGYLITALLLAEQRRNGHIRACRFYARRFLRLAPLSIVLTLVCLVIAKTSLSAVTGIALSAWGALSILLYYANWMAILAPGELGTMSHTWSLSIEEQFYFVWPWIVIGALAVSVRHARRFLGAVAATAIAAMGIARRQTWSAIPRAGGTTEALSATWLTIEHSSLLRPDGLLCGCLLALVIHESKVGRLGRRTVAAFGIVGATLATYVIVRASTPQPTFWIGFTAQWGLSLQNLGVTLLIAWLVLEPHSWAARGLSLRVLCWVGRRAYGIYLLHVLVIRVAVHRFHLARAELTVVTFAATFGLAAISFRYLETPFLALKERFSWRDAPSDAGVASDRLASDSLPSEGRSAS